MNQEDINKSVDYIYTQGRKYAEAKANLSYMQEYRKTIKAELMHLATELGAKSAVAAETEADRDQRYKEHLQAIKEAEKIAESLRWGLVSAQARIEVFRTIEASNRALDSSLS